MSVAAASVLFLLSTVGLFGLALLPALMELRHRVDARALPVTADGRHAHTWFAERFRDMLVRRLAGPMQDARQSEQVLWGEIDDGEAFVVLPEGKMSLETGVESQVDAVVLAVGDLDVEDGTALLREVYVEGRLRAGDDVLVRATLVNGDVEFGDRATSLRWLHSPSSVRFGEDAQLCGRVSSDSVLQIATHSRFERLHAPRIEFVGAEVPGSDASNPPELSNGHSLEDIAPEDLDAEVEVAGNRTWSEGDLAIPRGRRFTGDLVVRGELTIGDGAMVIGSVKAKYVRTAPGAVIEGALVSAGDARLAVGTHVNGPILVEGGLALGARVVVGSPDHPSTVRAEEIRVGPQSVIHGTVWTSEDGGMVSE